MAKTTQGKKYTEVTINDNGRKLVTFERVNVKTFTNFLLEKRVVKVTGLGTFTLTTKKTYSTLLPNSGVPTTIKGSMRIGFRPTSQLKQAIKNYGKNF